MLLINLIFIIIIIIINILFIIYNIELIIYFREMEQETPIRKVDNFSSHTFPIITDEKKANEIIDKILSNKTAVIGVDTEAAVEMSRFGILCLLQVIQKYY